MNITYWKNERRKKMSKATDQTNQKEAAVVNPPIQEGAQELADLEPLNDADVTGGCIFCGNPAHKIV
jgi:hypothetical protein